MVKWFTLGVPRWLGRRSPMEDDTEGHLRGDSVRLGVAPKHGDIKTDRLSLRKR